MNHCLVLDIGKTNKKAFVFDEAYQLVYETSARFPETTDEDGFPCEDIVLLRHWIQNTAEGMRKDPRFRLQAVNCTAYGASFVHLDAHFQALTPLYNYLKPFPEDLKQSFLETYGAAEKLTLETASPFLGHLNSGLQLLRLKHQQPALFQQIKYSLHLPQWAAWLLGGPCCSEITSLGCHTMLWDFGNNDYHPWVKAEGLLEKFAPMAPADALPVTGLHDSSSALIPYLASFKEPFLLISTGTWCISLNPFNQEPLTAYELKQDCLCYMSFTGNPVKAARYFGGNEHENFVRSLAAEYGLPEDFYQNESLHHTAASERYAIFMDELVRKQVASTRLALGTTPVRRIYVDGGFSKNESYMLRLAAHFPEMEVFAAELAQGTALGAAMVIHDHWNMHPFPEHLITLKKYEP